MLEKELEAFFKREAEKAGALVLKFVSPGKAGVPDRIVLAPGGRIYFAELKRPGEKPRPLQRHVIGQLRSLGFKVYVIDNREAVKSFVRKVLEGDDADA